MIELLRIGFDEAVSVSALTEALQQHRSGDEDDDLERLAIGFASFLHTVPDAVAVAVALSKDQRCGRAVAFATGPILMYLLDDDDLLPESSFGILGLLDDAYLVHSFVALLGQMFPFTAPATAGYTAPDARLFEVVSSFLPDGVAHALSRTGETTIRVAQALFPAARGTDDIVSGLHPEIRVGEAVRMATGVASA
jgi:uncharacterized membrane protein YkvA (DUF1232 family)